MRRDLFTILDKGNKGGTCVGEENGFQTVIDNS